MTKINDCTLTRGCTCTIVHNKCEYHGLEHEQFIFRAHIKQIQKNQIVLHERLMKIEKLLEPENIDVTALISEPLEWYEKKGD